MNSYLFSQNVKRRTSCKYLRKDSIYFGTFNGFEWLEIDHTNNILPIKPENRNSCCLIEGIFFTIYAREKLELSDPHFVRDRN